MRRLLCLCVCLCTLSSPVGAAAPGTGEGPSRRVTILFTNDFESAYDPVEAFWRDDVARIGGVAELAGLIGSLRAREAPVFLFDAGDIFTGTLARRTRGAVSFDFMQLMGYDAMVVGNHEFEYGWEAFAREKARAPFPVLGANLFYAGTDHPYAQPWTIVERGGVRVGVVGLLGRDAATALIPANIAGVEVRDPVATLRPLVERLRNEVDLLVVLVHQGPTAPMQTDDEADPRVYRGNRENLALAGAVPGIDVILAGHTDAGTPEALVHPGTGTLVMQTWGQGQHLGVLRLALDASGAIVTHDSALLAVDADRVVPDPVVAERLAAWRGRHPDLREVLGHSTGVLARRYYDEAPLGNLFADLVRGAADAEIGLMPSGALRRDLPAGPVRRVELLDAFPFEDHVARVELDGATLRAVLEQGFSLERGLLQLSGLRVLHDPDGPPGARVLAVCVNGEPLDPGRRYVVGTVEILAAGGDAYVQFRDAASVEYLPERYARTLESAFSAGRPVAVPALDRIVDEADAYACGR